LLGNNRRVRLLQVGVDLFELRIVFRLHAEMVHAWRLSAMGYGKVDPGIVEHPFGVVRFYNAGLLAKHRRIEGDAPIQVLYRDMHVKALHGLLLEIMLGAAATRAQEVCFRVPAAVPAGWPYQRRPNCYRRKFPKPDQSALSNVP
jgi:hypothetical protein